MPGKPARRQLVRHAAAVCGRMRAHACVRVVSQACGVNHRRRSPGVEKGEKTVIVQCPHCGKTVDLGRVTGRKPLNITVKNVCDALQAHGTVTAAANELGCSRGYIYKVLREAGMNLSG